MQRDTYPPGVPCWIDLVQDDLEAMQAFYRDLFGWSYEVKTPPEAPSSYAYAIHDGGSIGGVGGPRTDADPVGWTQYVCVSSADEVAALVTANGGTVVSGPDEVGPSGRVVQCVDPEGAHFGLWEPNELAGAAVVNIAGSWVLTELHTRDVQRAGAFYGAVFGWELGSFGIPGDHSGFFRLPGYGSFLAERDPAVAAWQEEGGGPEGFVDAVAVFQPIDDSTEVRPHWGVTFAVDDADAAVARAIELGATEAIPLFDTPFTRQSVVRDPQGAELSLSQYRPEGAG